MPRRGLVVAVLALTAVLLALVLWPRASRREHGHAHDDAHPHHHDDDGGGAEGVRARSTDSAARHVSGRVLDEAGDALDEGTVSLRCLGDDDEVTSLGAAIALDDDGRFEGPGCTGTICAALHHPTLVPATAWVLEPGKPIELRARALPRLVGTVEDRKGSPVAKARLSFVAADASDPGMVPTIGASTTTDADGTFAIALVAKPPCDPCTEASAGCDDTALPWVERLAVVAVAERFAPARVELDADPERLGDDPLEIRLAPPADTLSGSLTDPAGDPYPRAQVLARSQLRPEEQHTTAPDGDNFAFEALGEGPYDLRALQDGVELATAKGAVAGDDVELHGDRIADGPDVIVEIQARGRPLADVAVDGGPFRGARTDMQGQVRAEQAMPGDYTLLVRPKGGRGSRHPITIEPLAASPEPTVTRIEIQLPPPS